MPRRGRPRSPLTDEERAERRRAWVIEYNQRPDVIARRRASSRRSYRRKLANETPSERAERLAYDRFYRREKRANETPTEREERLARNRATAKRWREKRRQRETT